MKKLDDTLFVRSQGLAKMAADAFPFLQKNMSNITLSADDMRIIRQGGSYSETIVDRLFQRLAVQPDFEERFLPMDLSRVTEIPEILTTAVYTPYGKFLDIPHSPSIDRVWIDITPTLSRRKTPHDPLRIATVGKLRELFLRAHLVKSCGDKPRYLPPAISKLLVESYIMTICDRVGQSYNVSASDQTYVRTVLGYYYASRMSASPYDSMENPAALRACASLLGGNSVLERNLAIMHEAGGNRMLGRYADDTKPYTMEEIASILAKSGPSLMSTFDRTKWQMASNIITNDMNEMMIVNEYPPYFLMILLRMMAGHRYPYLSGVFRRTKLNKKADEAMRQLIGDGSFFSAT